MVSCGHRNVVNRKDSKQAMSELAEKKERVKTNRAQRVELTCRVDQPGAGVLQAGKIGWSSTAPGTKTLPGAAEIQAGKAA